MEFSLRKAGTKYIACCPFCDNELSSEIDNINKRMATFRCQKPDCNYTNIYSYSGPMKKSIECPLCKGVIKANRDSYGCGIYSTVYCCRTPQCRYTYIETIEFKKNKVDNLFKLLGIIENKNE